MAKPRSSVVFDDFSTPESFDFTLVARNERTKEREDHTFNAVKQLSGGAFMQLAMATGDQGLMNAYIRIILEACDDEDGLSYYWEPPVNPDTGAPWAAADIAEEDRDNPDSPLDPRLFREDQWSSRRRFAELAVDRFYFIPVKSFERMSEYLIENAAERPTWKPSRSSRGQEATSTGSADRSSSPESTSEESQQPNG